MTSNIKSIVSELPLQITELASEVESPDCGAVVTFSGNVRTFDNAKAVKSLTYEIHPSAANVLVSVVEEVCSKHNIVNARVAHRYGEIAIGESALFVAVSSPHRSAALNACSELVDEVKLRIPIWKHQVFLDGTDEWVNSA